LRNKRAVNRSRQKLAQLCTPKCTGCKMYREQGASSTYFSDKLHHGKSKNKRHSPVSVVLFIVRHLKRVVCAHRFPLSSCSLLKLPPVSPLSL
jgi:hypothetical protein